MYKKLIEFTIKSLDLFDPTCEEPQDFIRDEITQKEVLYFTFLNIINTFFQQNVKIK